MDRGLWTSLVAGFLAPVVLFSPLDDAGAWLAIWQKHNKPAAESPRASDARTPAERRPVVAADRTRAESLSAAKPRAAQSRNPETRNAARKQRAADRIAAPLARPLDPKEQLARTIDPAKQPDWHLVDPTLKRGDVLFLADKVVVFRGRKIGNLADYVPVTGARMLTRKERRQIEKLASGPRPSSPAADAKSNRLTLASVKSD